MTAVERLARKMKPRTRILLRLVDQRTEFKPDGSLARYFVPNVYEEHVGSDRILVSGSQDANALRGLERAGLVTPMRRTGAYSYAITAEGRAVVAVLARAATTTPATSAAKESDR